MKIEDIQLGKIVHISKIGMTYGMKATIVENDSTDDTKHKVKFSSGFNGYYRPDEMISEEDYKNFDNFNTEYMVRYNKFKEAEKLYNEYKYFLNEKGFLVNEKTGELYKG